MTDDSAATPADPPGGGTGSNALTFATFALVAAAVVAIEPWATQHPAPPRPPPEEDDDDTNEDGAGKSPVIQRPAPRVPRAEARTATPAKRPVPGSLPRSAVRDVVRDNVEDVRGCYAAAREEDPTSSARLSIEFTVGPKGKVKRTNLVVDHDDVQARRVGDCIAGASKRWRFPEREDEADAVVSYPFYMQAD